jgi:hypothetical protein
MNRKRILTIAAFLAVLTGAILAGYALWSPADGPGITKANFDRIEEDMTRDQVAIFGKPGRLSSGFLAGPAIISHEVWRAEDGAAATLTFINDRVHRKRWTESDETTSEKIQRWFRRATFQAA